MRERPLFWSAAAFAAGLIASYPDLPALCWAVCAATALAGGLLMACVACTEAALRAAALLVAGGFFGAARLAACGCEALHPGQIGTLVSLHPSLFAMGAEVAGTIAGPPRLRSHAGDAGRELELPVDVREIVMRGLTVPATGRVIVRLPAADPAARGDPMLRRGARVHFFARLFAPQRYRNPGSFDYARHLRARGIQATGTIKSRRLLRVDGRDAVGVSVSVLRRVDSLRERLLDQIDRCFADGIADVRSGAVAAALLLGERGGLSQEDETLLQEAGLSHLLAVSGFNVAVLAALVFFAVRFAGFAPRAAALATMPVLCLYLLVNRDESSVTRAVVMAMAWLAGRVIWRRPDLLNTLGLSALAILVFAPLQVHDAGFQLTFAATLSLILLAPPLSGAPGGRGAGRGALRWVRVSLAATVAATAGTLPLTIVHFHRVTPGALPANLVAGPLMAAAFLGVLGLEIVGTVCSWAATGLAWIVGLLVECVFLVAALIRHAPGLTYRRPTPSLALACVYAAALLLVCLLSREGRRGPARGCAAALGAAALVLVLPLDTASAPRGLRVTLLDVGQGESILIETPERRRVLVDAGGQARGDFDVGERVASAGLWRMGIARLDLLVVTHQDVDHLDGAASIVRNFRPQEVWLPAGAGAWCEGRSLARLRAAAIQTDTRLREMARGEFRELGGLRLEVLSPASPDAHGATDNERSLVLRALHAGRYALLPGDAGAPTEALLDPSVLPADLLKVGHHGSRSASSSSFLQRVRPKVAAISCGRNNRFGHPSGEVLGRLGSLGVRVCRTDLHGAVSVELLGAPGAATRLSPSCALGRHE